jgi:hypothetical protein
MIISKEDVQELETYAQACYDIILSCDVGICGKRYDPLTIDDTYLHSYIFNLKDGGRHHPINDYKDIEEIKDLMLKETIEYIKG